jgi:hypothetical protein
VQSQNTFENVEDGVYLKKVHEIDLAKAEIKKRANEWIAKAFKNSNYVTRMNSEDKIIAKGSFNVGGDIEAYGISTYSEQNVDYTLDLAFKDGRYKIEILDATIGQNNMSSPISAYLMDIDEYKDFMTKQANAFDESMKKIVLKRINNERKFKKDFETMKNYGEQIIPQLEDYFQAIDKSLNSFLKKKLDEDDW